MGYHKHCSNPRCGDQISPDAWVPLCWSCRLMMRVGLAAGAFTGALVAVLWEKWRLLP